MWKCVATTNILQMCVLCAYVGDGQNFENNGSLGFELSSCLTSAWVHVCLACKQPHDKSLMLKISQWRLIHSIFIHGNTMQAGCMIVMIADFPEYKHFLYKNFPSLIFSMTLESFNHSSISDVHLMNQGNIDQGPISLTIFPSQFKFDGNFT